MLPVVLASASLVALGACDSADTTIPEAESVPAEFRLSAEDLRLSAEELQLLCGDTGEVSVPPAIGSGGQAAPVTLNQPAGMTLIGSSDGSVLGGISGQSREPAFGIRGFGQWFEFNSRRPNVKLVDDPTNPTGSGKAIQVDVSSGGIGAIATATFPGQPYKELYIRFRVFRDGGTSSDAAHKWFYIGHAGSRQPTDHFVDTPFLSNTRNIRLVNNLGAGVFLNAAQGLVQGSSSSLGFDRWVTVELHLVAESARFAGDGEATMWVDGVRIAHRKGVAFTTRAAQSPAFGGMQWYAHHSNRGRDISYRIGEVYLAGRR